MKITRIIIIILLSLALPLLDIVTFRHSYDFNGDMGPDFYGLPFIYRTEIPWVNSFNGDSSTGLSVSLRPTYQNN
jgi:hypothetical protein